jgi:Bacterial regulatory proteins, tetR family
LDFKREFEIRAMTRPSEITRERVMKAAERLFAERGYEGTSVRAIVAKARVNQAAINYTSPARKDSTARFCARRSVP